MARDEYDHLRESSDSVQDSKFVLVDQINGNAFGLFDSPSDATTAALTGAEEVGGVPWGDDGWEVVTLADFKRDHDEEGVNAYWSDINSTTGQAVIAEIGREIDNGDAHLLTRNELAEFVEWLVTDERSVVVNNAEGDDWTINEAIYVYMNGGDFNAACKEFAAVVAKKFFVHKGYER